MAVYLIQFGEADAPVKIGYAADVKRRVQHLETAHPTKARILRVLDGDMAAERLLHRRFAEYRISKEWFRFSDRMLSDDLGIQDLPIPSLSRKQRRLSGSSISEFAKWNAAASDAPADPGSPLWQLRRLVAAYLSATGASLSSIGKACLNDAHALVRINEGSGFRVGTFERLVLWFSQNWPETTPWPDCVGRPGTLTHSQKELLSAIEAFVRMADMAETTFGRKVVNDGKFVGRLRAGKPMTIALLDRVRAFLRENDMGVAA